MIPTRGRGGGHDWIGVDALLWVDHVEICLLLSRIKAVWGAMRHVRVVVAIVMVHEVQRDELESPVRRIYKKKKGEESRKKEKEGEEEAKEKRRGNGHWLESKGRGDEVRFDSRTTRPFTSFLKKKNDIFIFILILTVSFRGTIHASGILSMNDDSRHATSIDIEYRKVR
jgi:hypothetical protein